MGTLCFSISSKSGLTCSHRFRVSGVWDWKLQGLLRPRLQTGTASLPQIHPKFRDWGNRLYFLKGEIANTVIIPFHSITDLFWV